MQFTKTSLKPPPSQPDGEKIKSDFLNYKFQTFRTFFSRVASKHKRECHPGTHPEDKHIFKWLDDEYKARNDAKIDEYKRRNGQIKDYRRNKLSEVEVKALTEWLTTEISTCSRFCRRNSTYAPGCTTYSTYALK
jgi:hypothetical protein